MSDTLPLGVRRVSPIDELSGSLEQLLVVVDVNLTEVTAVSERFNTTARLWLKPRLPLRR